MTCVYCGAEGDLESINPVTGNQACRITELCQLRAQGLDPVQLTLTLVRGLVKQAWADIEARNAAGQPGSPRRAAFRGRLSGTDLARLHVVLTAATRWLDVSGWADSALLLKEAELDYGCRTCGMVGSQDCVTSSGAPVPRRHGLWGPRWHAGRTL